MRGMVFLRTKKYSAKILLLITALLVSVISVPEVCADALTVPQIRRMLDMGASGTELGILESSGYSYKDKFYNFSSQYSMSSYSQSTVVYNGTNAFRMNFYNRTNDTGGVFTMDYMYTAFTSTVAVPRCVDYESTALQFAYNPRYERENSYVGITCRTAGEGTAALMISLKDYIGLTGADYAKDEWIKVTVPLKYFEENGEFETVKGSSTTFKMHCTNGVIFAYSLENMLNAPSSTLIAYVDDVRFVSVPVPPKNLKYFTNGSSVTLSWNGLSGNTADIYKVYRNGSLLSTVTGEASYTDNTVVNGTSYVYSVLSVKADGAKSVSSHIEITAGNQNVALFTESEGLSAHAGGAAFSENAAALMFSGSEGADLFAIYKNSSPYGKSSSGYFYDAAFTEGDSYEIYALNTEEGKKSAAVSATGESAVEEKERYVAFAIDKTVINENIPLIANWNRHSTATTGTAAVLGANLQYIGYASTPMHQRKGAAANFTVPGTDRYRMMPITTMTKSGSTVTLGTEPKSGAAFNAVIDDFGETNLTVEIAKGIDYTSNVKGVKIGLAYIDKNTTTTYTTSSNTSQTVYATGISWYDVTSDVSSLAAYNASNLWNSVKGTVSVNVNDIINNGAQVYLHGASASNHRVTVENANAVVIDFVYADSTTTKSNSKVLLFDNLAFEKSFVSELDDGDVSVGESSFSAALTDESGNIYNGEITEGAYPDRIKIKSVNAGTSSKTVNFAAAMYDEDDKLTDVKMFGAALPLGRAEQTLYTGFYNDVPGTRKIKLLMFDGCGQTKPVSAPEASQFTVNKKAADGTVTVLDDEYQTITGWGISPFLLSDNDFRSFSDYEDWKEMYDALYGELGITSVRVPIDKECGYTTEPEDEELKDKPVYSQLDYIVKYIERAKDFGIDDWILCFWSPPKYMIEKRYISYRGAELWAVKTDCIDMYCRYMINVIDYLKENGVGTPMGVCFQNEPQSGNVNPTYEPELFIYTAKRFRTMLDEAGYEDIPIQGAEAAAYYNGFRYTGGTAEAYNYNNYINDPDYANAIGIFSTHTYIEAGKSKDSDVSTFATETAKFPDKERWMTEFSGLGQEESVNTGDYVMGPALFTMRVLSSDVGWAGMNRWYYWRAFVTHYNPDENGASYDVLNDKFSQQAVLYGQPGGKVVKSKLYKCLSLLFNNVPVGSKVKRMSSTVSSLVNRSALKSDLLAFETEKGTVVMLVNTAMQAKSVNFAGLTGSKAEIYSVTKNYDGIIKASEELYGGSIESVHIPPRSVSFVVTSD